MSHTSVAAGAEVGHHNGNIRAHHGQCARVIGWVGAGKEGEGKGEGSQDGDGGGGGDRRGQKGAEGDGDGDMEVEEMLKEAEKLADEAERVEKDVMEE